MTDSELVEGLRGHDPDALQRVREYYLPSLWRYVVPRVDGDMHIAEDIVSETMLALVKALDGQSFDAPIINLVGWLRSVAHNKVQDHFRAVVRVRHLIDAAKQTLPAADHDSDPARRMETDQRCREVRCAMDQLPDQYRIALEWKYLDRLSTREISERWGMTEKAAESILFRARREFRVRVQRTQSTVSSAAVRSHDSASATSSQTEQSPSPAACDMSKP